MSNKDRIRAETEGLVFRDGKLVKIGENRPERSTLYLTCSKCHHSIPEYMVVEHIKTCQGGRAECGKCHWPIPAKDFMEHYRNCRKEGKKR